MPENPALLAETFRFDLVEVLKALNWGAEEEPEVGGIETSEILGRLRKGACPTITETLLNEAIATLVANRMAEPQDQIRYAWGRGRMVGRRYALTVTGKKFLIDQLERAGRIR